MQLYHCVIEAGNFGDDMNLWFWDELVPGWRDLAPQATLFGIGTILTGAALRDTPHPVVFGSGTGYGHIRPEDMGNAQFLWVRGPHTAAKLGRDADLAITDPAVMTPRLPSFAQPAQRSGLPVFVPHHTTAKLNLDWAKIGAMAGVDVVLPHEDAHHVLARLRDAPLVLAESMHAAILADAFRTPWIAVRISHVFNDFKWQDWADSMQVDLQVQQTLTPLRRGYGWLKSLRQAAPRQSGAKTDAMAANHPVAQPVAQNPRPATPAPASADSREKAALKALINLASPVFGRMLARDLKKALRSPPQLSDDDVLLRRQQQIFDRIGDWRRRETA